MPNIKPGDRVRISSREATLRDARTGLFYTHYRGLVGSVSKVFPGNEVAVEVDLETLPEDVWTRHMTVRDQMRQRWLDGLPEEQRRRMTPDQKEFNLRYVVLVSAEDLERRRTTRRSNV